MPVCIYCREPTSDDEAVAHIFPESLVGDSEFRLENGEVCTRCNQGISRFERQLIDQLGMMGLLIGPATSKSGKPRRVAKRAFLGSRGEGGKPHVVFNLGTRKMGAPDGTIVSPPKTDDDRPEVDVDALSQGGPFTMSLPFRFSKGVLRVMHKIAFETLCYHHGPQVCLDRSLDGVRQYIHSGRGKRFVLVRHTEVAGEDAGAVSITLRDLDGFGRAWGTDIRLVFDLFVDLTPDCSYIRFADETLDDDGHSQVNFMPHRPSKELSD